MSSRFATPFKDSFAPKAVTHSAGQRVVGLLNRAPCHTGATDNIPHPNAFIFPTPVVTS